MLHLTSWIATAALCALAHSTPAPGSAAACQQALIQQQPVSPSVSDWIVDASDSICGLRDPEQLSKPAVVNFERCLAGTPELKRMKKEGIRPNTPEGIQLRTEAVDRVTNAANTVRKAGGFCSVWKSIEHRDGRTIPDLTSRVLGQY
jgi:hypothetical protein